MFFLKPKKPSFRSVLFVCTANITRSTAAEALFRDQVDKTNEKWDITSAGVKALKGPFLQKGSFPHPVVNNYLHKTKNLPIYNHRAQQVTKKLLNHYYWIFVMENAHKIYLNKLGVPLESRMFTVREFGLNEPPLEPDMPDPTGSETENYQQLFAILDYEIPRIANIITNIVFELEESDYL